MSGLPEYVYLITVDGEWPVSAIADCHPTTPETIEREVDRRTTAENRQARGRAHVWKIPVTDAVEVELVPSTRVPPSLKAKT